MKALLIAMITVGLTIGLCALDDTPANRAKLAGKLIQTFPIQDLWESLERQIPEQQRELASALFQHVHWKSFTKSIQQILTETYTADEIKALTDAYSSPCTDRFSGSKDRPSSRPTNCAQLKSFLAAQSDNRS